MRSIVFALAALVALFAASRGSASAALRVCNGTGGSVAVALAAVVPNDTGVQTVSEGWFQVDAQACQNVVDTDLDPGTLYYLYAKGTLLTWSGTLKKGAKDAAFCTNFAGRFAYTDRASNVCTGAGEEMSTFIYEPVAGPNWTIVLNNP